MKLVLLLSIWIAYKTCKLLNLLIRHRTPIQCPSFNRENPSIILFPNSQKGSRLHICLEKICDSASSIQVMIVARKYFDETEGQHLLTELMVHIMERTWVQERGPRFKSREGHGEEILSIGCFCGDRDIAFMNSAVSTNTWNAIKVPCYIHIQCVLNGEVNMK